MKKLFSTLLFLLSVVQTNAQSAYHNLEKYWWYRYRLVNDFMYIDESGNDSVGSNIPAQKRIYYESPLPDDHPIPYHDTPHDGVGLGWEDATTELGHYIGALAVEYRMLKDNGWNTERTEKRVILCNKSF